jgi:hypothetical protein
MAIDNAVPEAGVILDANGNLYDTTPRGGPYDNSGADLGGTLLELIAPSVSGGAHG